MAPKLPFYERFRRYRKDETTPNVTVLSITPPGMQNKPMGPEMAARMEYTGAGADGIVQPSMPTEMVQTTKGPRMLHEGEGKMQQPDGRIIVVPQTALHKMEHADKVPGYQFGGGFTPIPPKPKVGTTPPTVPTPAPPGTQPGINPPSPTPDPNTAVPTITPNITARDVISNFSRNTITSPQPPPPVNLNLQPGAAPVSQPIQIPTQQPISGQPLNLNLQPAQAPLVRQLPVPQVPVVEPINLTLQPGAAPAPPQIESQGTTDEKAGMLEYMKAMGYGTPNPGEAAAADTITPPRVVETTDEVPPPATTGTAGSTYGTGADTAFQQLQGFAAGDRFAGINQSYLDRFDVNTRAQIQAQEQRIRSNPNIPEGAKNAMIADLYRQAGSTRSGMAADMAKTSAERMYQASRDVFTYGRSALNEERSFTRQSYEDAITQGNFDDAANNFERLYGYKPNMQEMRDDFNFKKMQARQPEIADMLSDAANYLLDSDPATQAKGQQIIDDLKAKGYPISNTAVMTAKSTWLKNRIDTVTGQIQSILAANPDADVSALSQSLGTLYKQQNQLLGLPVIENIDSIVDSLRPGSTTPDLKAAGIMANYVSTTAADWWFNGEGFMYRNMLTQSPEGKALVDRAMGGDTTAATDLGIIIGAAMMWDNGGLKDQPATNPAVAALAKYGLVNLASQQSGAAPATPPAAGVSDLGVPTIAPPVPGAPGGEVPPPPPPPPPLLQKTVGDALYTWWNGTDAAEYKTALSSTDAGMKLVSAAEGGDATAIQKVSAIIRAANKDSRGDLEGEGMDNPDVKLLVENGLMKKPAIINWTTEEGLALRDKLGLGQQGVTPYSGYSSAELRDFSAAYKDGDPTAAKYVTKGITPSAVGKDFNTVRSWSYKNEGKFFDIGGKLYLLEDRWDNGTSGSDGDTTVILKFIDVESGNQAELMYLNGNWFINGANGRKGAPMTKAGQIASII